MPKLVFLVTLSVAATRACPPAPIAGTGPPLATLERATFADIRLQRAPRRFLLLSCRGAAKAIIVGR